MQESIFRRLRFNTEDKNFESEDVWEKAEAPGRRKCIIEAMEIENDAYNGRKFLEVFSVSGRAFFLHAEFWTKWEVESKLVILLT